MEEIGSYIYYLIIVLYGLYKFFISGKKKKENAPPKAPTAEESWHHEKERKRQKPSGPPDEPNSLDELKRMLFPPVQEIQENQPLNRNIEKAEAPERTARVAPQKKELTLVATGRQVAAAERIANTKVWEDRTRAERERREGLIRDTRMTYVPLKKRALVAKTLEKKKNLRDRNMGSYIPDARDMERTLLRQGGAATQNRYAVMLSTRESARDALVLKEVLEKKY